MRNRAFGMFSRNIGVAGLAVFDSLLEVLNAFIKMRVLQVLLCRFRMLECPFCMLY